MQSLQVVSGDQLFIIPRVKRSYSSYKPTYLSREPVEIDTYITVVYAADSSFPNRLQGTRLKKPRGAGPTSATWAFLPHRATEVAAEPSEIPYDGRNLQSLRS